MSFSGLRHRAEGGTAYDAAPLSACSMGVAALARLRHARRLAVSATLSLLLAFCGTVVPLGQPSALADVRKEELPENINRRIFVFERASQLEIMAANTETFMWVSPTPTETLERFNLVQRACPDNRKLYRDLLIYPKDYHLTRLDKMFIEELYKAKNLYMK